MAGTKGRRWKCRSKPCCVCGRWFEPHPRVGARQKTCGRASCKAELHKLSCRRFRAAERDQDREARLRKQIRRAEGEVSERACSVDPLRQMDWIEVRDLVGPEVAVIIHESGQMLVKWTREVVAPQPPGNRGESR